MVVHGTDDAEISLAGLGVILTWCLLLLLSGKLTFARAFAGSRALFYGLQYMIYKNRSLPEVGLRAVTTTRSKAGMASLIHHAAMFRSSGQR